MFVDLSHYHFPIFLDFPLLLLGPHLPPVLGCLMIGRKNQNWKRSPLYCDWQLCGWSNHSSVCSCSRNLHIWNPEEGKLSSKKFSSQVADIVVWMNGPPAEFAIPLVGSKMSISASADLLNGWSQTPGLVLLDIWAPLSAYLIWVVLRVYMLR